MQTLVFAFIPRNSNSFNKQYTYIDSSRPGPGSLWTATQESRISFPHLFSCSLVIIILIRLQSDIELKIKVSPVTTGSKKQNSNRFFRIGKKKKNKQKRKECQNRYHEFP